MFPFFSGPFPTGINWIQSADFLYTSVLWVVMSIVKQKRETKEVGIGGWTVLEESNGVVEAGLELSGSLNMNKLHCCVEIFASCLYYPLYSVWMWLPGEHHDKKKCTPKKEGGGRMDTGREQRGGVVDKERRVKFIRGVWKRRGGSGPNQQKHSVNKATKLKLVIWQKIERVTNIGKANETEESISAAPDYHVNDRSRSCGKEAFVFS